MSSVNVKLIPRSTPNTFEAGTVRQTSESATAYSPQV